MNKRQKIQSMKKWFEMNDMSLVVEQRRKEYGAIWMNDEGKCVRASRSNIPRMKRSRLLHMVIPLKSKHLSSCKRRVASTHDMYGQVEAASSTLELAEGVQANLDSNFPSFVKPMIRSNVTAGFWLSLPKLFAELHMPDRDATITLIDEDKNEYPTKYLAERRGLSGGWRGFSLAHNLEEGDALVFHLVRSYKMQVYIVRSNHLAEVDAALCLLNLDAHVKRTDSGPKNWDVGVDLAGENCRRPDLQEVSQNDPDKCSLDSNIEGDSSCKLEENGETPPLSFLQEVAQNNIEKFPSSNDIGGVMKYPGNFWEDLQLAFEGLLSETCGIASTVKASKMNTNSNDSEISSKRLTGYDQLQSHLLRIHARMDQLVSIVLCYGGWDQTCCHEEGFISSQETYRYALEGLMLELKEAIERLYAEIEVLKTTNERH